MRQELRQLGLGLLAPALALPFIVRPELGLVLVVFVVALFLAWLSPAIPLGLSGMAAWFAPLLGVTPPPNSVVVGLAAWVVLATGIAIFRDREQTFFLSRAWAPVILALLLFALMLVRLNGSDAPVYGQQKLGLFVLGSLLFTIAAIQVARHSRDIEILLVLIGGVATLASAVLIVQLVSGLEPTHPGRYSLESAGNPIELGQQASVGILVATYFALTRDGWMRQAAVAALPLLGVALLASGSRGPLIGLLAGATILFVLLYRNGGAPIDLKTVGAAAAGVVAVAVAIAPGQAASRLFGIFTGSDQGRDSNGRSELWGAAIDHIAQSPIAGLGTGGFSAVAPGDQLYPHNFLLEGAVEFGLLGFFLAAGVIGLGLMKVREIFRAPDLNPLGLTTIVAAYFAASAVHGMFSGDIAANPQMWISLGLLTAVVAPNYVQWRPTESAADTPTPAASQ